VRLAERLFVGQPVSQLAEFVAASLSPGQLEVRTCGGTQTGTCWMALGEADVFVGFIAHVPPRLAPAGGAVAFLPNAICTWTNETRLTGQLRLGRQANTRGRNKCWWWRQHWMDGPQMTRDQPPSLRLECAS